MKNLILSCNTIRAELDQTLKKLNCDYPVIYLESGLHNDPQKLNFAMQEVIDRVSNVENILVIMGFCGNAVVGLKAGLGRVIVPRVDDCITMLLGSLEKRREISREKPTYYLSKGWIDSYNEVEKTMMGDLDALEARYGKERAMRIFRMTYRNYRRIGLIDTGTFDMAELHDGAREQSELMELPIEEVPGTMSYMEKFVKGPWDDKDFIILEKGQELKLEDTFLK
ncbi:DUF1638 domain-containing protein [Alkalibacter mobilis]|uniref:DUF1638 domain-containing protein n=1 Tax=Alkalibacter mobilis TaxID=2787712 RepID=UPI00189FA479|nr:DUF1638 domain-containing protein [Alkalibacter mobilis]MBF7096379.1 DUF1638 domain-containing protein [Alkalibacter mobilis]